MAKPFVFIDGKEGNDGRMIPEPKFYRRIRRAKEIWNAFMFLARGGKFKVHLDFSEIDPRILKPVRLFVVNDGMVVDVEFYRRNAVAGSARKMEVAGLTLAADDEPGFRVRWRDYSRKGAWEAAGFEVSATPTEFIVSPKEAHHG